MTARRTRPVLAIPAIAFILIACACSEAPNFDGNYDIAKNNALSGVGAKYHQQLNALLVKTPDLPRSLSVCMGGDLSQTSAHGYFLIKSPTDYKLVLKPKGRLADCLCKIFGGETLPPPPATPYLSPFEFGVTH
jgi:hypothetical protein